MKLCVFPLLLIAFLLPGSVLVWAEAIPVEVLTNSFHARGSCGDSPGAFPPNGSYDMAGMIPQSGDLNCYDATAGSAADLFDVSVSVSSGLWFAGAEAQTDVTFKPLRDFNTLNFSAGDAFFWFWYYFNGSLVDLTDNLKLWEESIGPGGWSLPPFVPLPINHAFESDHVYSMHLYACASAGGDFTTVSFGFPDLQAVPEPGCPLFFICMSLVPIILVCRWWQK